jgi:hypothetical protein
MRRLKNKSGKGKKIEKEFAYQLQSLFNSAETELKPRIINLKKDFWGIFDGLTFIKSKRIYLFWQIKSKKISSKEFKYFWYKARLFSNNSIKILLVENYKNKIKIYFSNNPKKYLDNIKSIKKII